MDADICLNTIEPFTGRYRFGKGTKCEEKREKITGL